MIEIVMLLLGRHVIQRRWPVVATVGWLWVVLGAFVMIDAVDGHTLIQPHMFGYLIIPEGLVSILAALGRSGAARRARLIKGVVLLAAAALILSRYPGHSFLLAVLLGLLFLVDGSMRVASAYVVQFPGWKKTMVAGFVEIVIAIITLQPWPTWYDGTIGFNVGVVLIISGLTLLRIAKRIRQLRPDAPISALFTDDPVLSSLAPLRPDEAAHLRDLIVHVWTPTGTASTPMHRAPIDRYIAAVGPNGAISTGHAALEVAEVYISHYPASDIDRNPDEFRRMLRATPDNNVPGRFLPSYREEADGWCPSTVQVVFPGVQADRLRAFWEAYRQNTTYNLTHRNCSSVVANALDAALEGILSQRPGKAMSVLGIVSSPELWAASLIRQRAESMAWTPGLVLDYARALRALIHPHSVSWMEAFRFWRRLTKTREPDAVPAEERV